MANQSIYAAFERMWQHINVLFGKKQNKFADITSDDSGTTLTIENNLLINAPIRFELTSDGIEMDGRDGTVTVQTTDQVQINGGAGVIIESNANNSIELKGTGIVINGIDDTVNIQTGDEVCINGSAGVWIENVMNPTNELDAANKVYVDNTIKSFLVISSTQPNASEYPEGALWIQPS